MVGRRILAMLRIPRWRTLGPVLVFAAGLPAVCLTLDYFESTRFVEHGAARRLVDHSLTTLQGKGAGLWKDIAAVDRELFECHAGVRVPFSLFVLAYYVLLVYFTVAGGQESGGRSQESGVRGQESGEQRYLPSPSWLFPFLFGLLLFAAYLLVPDNLHQHGGVLKARLALLPPLVWLACLREPARLGMRVVSRTLALA